MASILKTCFQSLLKLVNSIIGMIGMAMILYGLWMIRYWQLHVPQSPNSPIPWFIYTTLGIGVSMCVLACTGHVAAETANGHCLSCYTFFVAFFTLLEAAVTADVYLNHYWEEDFPTDPTGMFNDLKHFVKSNFDFCKWVGLSVVAVQGLSILFSMILRAIGPGQSQDSDSDDDYVPARLPLLINQTHPPTYVVGEPHVPPKNDNWNIRIFDKTNR